MVSMMIIDYIDFNHGAPRHISDALKYRSTPDDDHTHAYRHGAGAFSRPAPLAPAVLWRLGRPGCRSCRPSADFRLGRHPAGPRSGGGARRHQTDLSDADRGFPGPLA